MMRHPRLALLAIAFTALAATHVVADEPDTFSPVVSFLFEDSLVESDASTTITSSVVSFLYEETPSEPETPIMSPVVSFLYEEWPGDENLAFQNSPAVSYSFDGTPIIVTQPHDLVAYAGTAMSLSVQASVNPPFTYQWRKNGAVLPGRTTPALSLGNAQKADSGTYSVVVANSYGQVTSQLADVTIIGRPLTPKPGNPLQTHVSTPLASSLANRPTRAVSAQLRWFNPVSQSFEDVPPAGDARRNAMAGKMTVVITHGWQDGVAYERDHPADHPWIAPMAMALSQPGQPFTGNINIVAWDWGNFANVDTNLLWGPGTVSVYIPGQGASLGGALMDMLGTGYALPIHFIGHSFGTGVNCAAADYIHGDSRPTGDARPKYPAFNAAKTHMTLLDEAELAAASKWYHLVGDSIAAHWSETALDDGVDQVKNLFIKVIPDHYGFIDNYISEVGFLHSEASNALLFRKNYMDVLFGQHRYAVEWYLQTIQTPDNLLMGHRFSFERNTRASAPSAGTYFRQSLDIHSSELALIQTNWAVAEAASIGRTLVYPTEKIGELLAGPVQDATVELAKSTYRTYTATGNFIQQAEIKAIDYSANAIVDQIEAFSKPNGPPVFLPDTDPSTPAYFQQAKPTSAAPTDNAWWDTTITLSGGLSLPLTQAGQPRIAKNEVKTQSSALSVGQSTLGDATNASYVSLATHVPLEAVGLTFEYRMTNAGVDDFMSVGMDGESLCALDARYIPDGVWQSTPVFQVSDFRGRDVNMVIAFLAATGPPSGSLSIRNIQFYIPPRPSLNIGTENGQLKLEWPVSAIDWTVESSNDLVNWTPVLSPPIDLDYRHTLNFGISGPQQFFRLRK